MSRLQPARSIDLSAKVDQRGPGAGTIQPHGILAIVAADGGTIECVSENVELLLGIPAAELCGQPLAVLLSNPEARAFGSKFRGPQLAARNPHALELIGRDGKRLHVEGTVQRGDAGRWLIELEPSAAAPEPSGYGQAEVPIERLVRAVDIPALLSAAADDVRILSGFSRVIVYRFDRDWQADAVAQAAGAGAAAFAPDRHDAPGRLPETLRRFLLRSPLRIVPDTGYVPARLVAGDGCTAPAATDISRAALGGVIPEYLEWFGQSRSAALLTLSIVINGQLWGVITCHHDRRRTLSYRRRAVCEFFGHLLEWQLDTRLKRERLHEHARASALQSQIAAAVAVAGDLGAAAVDAAPLVRELFAADGAIVRMSDAIGRSGGVPGDDAVIFEAAAALNARAENGVATSRTPLATLYIRLAPDGRSFIMAFRVAPPHAGRWSDDEVRSALTLMTALNAHLRTRERQLSEPAPELDGQLNGRNAQAALIKLHEDVAAAQPSRHAITQVILDYARRQTCASGSMMETLTETEVVAEAASGVFAPCLGKRGPRAGSLSGSSADLNGPLRCDDAEHDLESDERDACRRLGIASLVVVPVQVSATETIVLKVSSARTRAFTDDDVERLKLAATNLRTAIRAAHEFAALTSAEREQRAYARRLRALHAIASTTRSNRRDQIDAALHLGLEQLDLDWAFLGVIDYATREFVIENSVSRDRTKTVEAGLRTPLGSTLIGHVAQTKGVRIVQDASQSGEPRVFGAWSSYITAPLFIAGVNYGTIGFTSRAARPNPFSEANIEFVAVAGELISSAVERALQRERLETSEARYRALTEAIPQMVWVIDAADRFEYVNARWTAYTGLTLEESRAQGRERLYDAAHLPIVTAGRRADPPAEYECEVRLRRRDDTFRWHLVRSVPFRDSAGAAGKWLITATDIEERKSAETIMANVHGAALAATEAKSRFLATMSHEIRTPMNAVIGMTELLLLTQLSDEQREYIEIVRDSGQSLLRVLNDILDYSKIEAGKLELETVRFDLRAQMESVVELLRAQYQIKGVRLTTNISAEVPAIVAGDPGRLRQILLNLAGNALKFTAEGGSVHVAIDVPADSSRPVADDALRPIRFTIEDTGIGIPPEIVARLFQPFSQGDESTTRKYGGTGLGLSICAQLVALMKGTIGVRSVAGEGSAFWFEIPLRGAKTSAKAFDGRKRSPRPKPVVMRAEKILLVEDNEINTFLALKQLQRIGFIVSAVNNGQQAVEAVTRERFDLVFMDCHMPEMDGFAATREIRRLEAGGQHHLPIVAMTADARTEDHQNCLRAGMDDYVSKPTSLDSLRLVLDRWLPSPDRRQNSRAPAPRSNPPAMLPVAKLLELFDGDRNAVITLLTAAAGSIKADFARIENCVLAADLVAVAEAAHRLKGTSASIRSPRLGEISAALEHAAANAQISDGLLVELRAAVETLIEDVERHSKVLATIG